VSENGTEERERKRETGERGKRKEEMRGRERRM
jgi:hypothetical protein